MRAIDGEELMHSVDFILSRVKTPEIVSVFQNLKSYLENAPTLTLDDLRPKGRWNGDGSCSYCGMRNPTCRTDDLADWFPVSSVQFEYLQFCPNCGADMRGGGEDGESNASDQ